MRQKKSSPTDWTVFIVSGGFLLLFVILSLINDEMVGNWISQSFDFSAKYFGAYWQLLLLATFVIGLILAFTKYGHVRLGNKDKPENGNYRWISMIMCTLLAGGGVFWAAAEPMFHFMTTPPLLEGDTMSPTGVQSALAQSYLHWGFLAWAILGSLTTVVLMYVHYHKGYPLKPRAILYPIFGKKIYRNSIIGATADVVSIVSVAAGTMGPIGFLGLQVGYGLNALFDIPNSLTTNIIIIGILVFIAAISAATGVDRGIQFLSRLNIGFTVLLMIFMLIVGPTLFLIDSFISSESYLLQNFLSMALYRGDEAWLGSWTVFFWGWFLGYGPMMGIFISRISRGRTIRQLIIAVSIIAPIVSNFWFTVVGGTGVNLEMNNAGSVSTALNESGMPAAVIAIMQQLPLGTLLAVGFLIVTIIFVATTTDSISYTVAVTITGDDHPQRWIRVFWALIFGALSVMLLTIGEGSITAIQNSIVVTAVPVSFLLLPPLWLAPKIAGTMAAEQGIVHAKEKSSQK